MTRSLFSAAVLAAALALAAPARADPLEQHFAPEEDLEAIDAALFDGAARSIDLAAYVLTDRRLVAALADAARRGVAVRVVGDSRMWAYAKPDLARELGRSAAGVRLAARAALMHLKAYCVDHAILRVGAANFSWSGLHEQDNDLELVRGPHACDRFEAKFQSMWWTAR